MTNERDNKESDLAQIRREYARLSLRKADLDSDPIAQFQRWFAQAQEAGVADPTAMTLATVSAQSEPSARIVLLKGVDEQGFVFYTNYDSKKGTDIAANQAVALVFYWYELERQVRVRGSARQIDYAASAEYFHSRPRGSQLSALLSQQSQPIANRHCLEQQMAQLESRHQGEQIPMPEQWGGYCVAPDSIEFWQGRRNRLHDRLVYERRGQAWQISRLQP